MDFVLKKRSLFLFVSLFIFLSCGGKSAHQPDSITISVPYEVYSLDPHLKANLSDLTIASTFYEPLVMTDAEMKIQPCLAKSWENPDASTWVFHLEPSVRFHDGRPMRAEDVVYSFERLFRDQQLEQRSLLTNVEKASVIDRFTVRIRTAGPMAVFLNKLSSVMIVPEGSTTETLERQVNGTGPYKLVEWKKGEWIAMARNENYWNNKPALREVHFYLSRSSEQAIDDLLSGRSQLVQCNSKKTQERLRDRQRYRILAHDNLFLKYLSYDLLRDATPYCSIRPNPFRNKLVRQAMHISLDREQLIRRLPTYAVTATQPIPPFVFGYNPAIQPAVPGLVEARSLLGKAGLPEGFKVTLHSRQILEETAFAVKDQLEKLGILVEVKVLPDSEFFDALDRRELTFFLSRLAATVGDASDILESAMHSKDSSGRYGILNYADYSNSEIDRAIEESARIMKIEDRRTKLEQVMRMLMEDLPWIPLYVDQDVYAIEESYSWQPRADSFVLAQEIHVP